MYIQIYIQYNPPVKYYQGIMITKFIRLNNMCLHSEKTAVTNKME